MRAQSSIATTCSPSSQTCTATGETSLTSVVVQTVELSLARRIATLAGAVAGAGFPAFFFAGVAGVTCETKAALADLVSDSWGLCHESAKVARAEIRMMMQSASRPRLGFMKVPSPGFDACGCEKFRSRS